MAYKMTGKFADTVERPEAVAEFFLFWMPYNAPEHWEDDWEEFKRGMFASGWITEWQYKNWDMPNL